MYVKECGTNFIPVSFRYSFQYAFVNLPSPHVSLFMIRNLFMGKQYIIF